MIRFIDWCDTINPSWIGCVVCLSTVFMAAGIFTASILATNGYILLAVLGAVVYAWFIAIFKQGTKKMIRDTIGAFCLFAIPVMGMYINYGFGG